MHLARERDEKAIVRSGIKPSPYDGDALGVYAMPVLPDFFASHQWLRELRRRSPVPLVAIGFVIADDEEVRVGHYSVPHTPMTAAEASGVILGAEDPRGYEVVILRKIEPTEIRRSRSVRKSSAGATGPMLTGSVRALATCASAARTRRRACAGRLERSPGRAAYCGKGSGAGEPLRATATWRRESPRKRAVGSAACQISCAKGMPGFFLARACASRRYASTMPSGSSLLRRRNARPMSRGASVSPPSSPTPRPACPRSPLIRRGPAAAVAPALAVRHQTLVGAGAWPDGRRRGGCDRGPRSRPTRGLGRERR
jgi:hypothetical protein